MPGNHKLFCIQGGSRSWEFGYREEMEKFAADVPWFKYVSTISRPWEDEKWSGQTGRVDDLVRQYATEWGLKPSETTDICAVIRIWWKIAAEFCSAQAGRKEACSRKFISSRRKKIEREYFRGQLNFQRATGG